MAASVRGARIGRFSRSDPGARLAHAWFVHIDIVADRSIGGQARTYAEYRLFVAISESGDSHQVKRAAIVLRGAKTRRHGEWVVCTMTVELAQRLVTVKASDAHPCGAINRAVERLRRDFGGRRDPSQGAAGVAEPALDADDRRPAAAAGRHRNLD